MERKVVVKEERSYHPLPHSNDDDAGEFTKSIRDAPPTHYTFKIESFSIISKTKMERYDSSNFEAGGYKWKLSLYPNGNKKRNVNNHLSLYLVIQETSSLPPGWEVNVVFQFFVFDQILDKYLMLEDIDRRGRRFHVMKTEWGFNKLIPLRTFNDPSNGYLVEDTCVFGAEVFVIKSTGAGECLSMIKIPDSCKHTWNIQKFSEKDSECYYSEAFTSQGHQWKVKLHPKGSGNGSGKYISLYFLLADHTTLPPKSQVYLEYSLRILDQIHGKHSESQDQDWFSLSSKGWGWSKFLPLSDFNDPTQGFLVKDSCIIEAEFTVLGIVNELQGT